MFENSKNLNHCVSGANLYDEILNWHKPFISKRKRTVLLDTSIFVSQFVTKPDPNPMTMSSIKKTNVLNNPIVKYSIWDGLFQTGAVSPVNSPL